MANRKIFWVNVKKIPPKNLNWRFWKKNLRIDHSGLAAYLKKTNKTNAIHRWESDLF